MERKGRVGSGGREYGPYYYGRGKEGKKGDRKENKGRKGRERKGFAGPMSNCFIQSNLEQSVTLCLIYKNRLRHSNI